MRCTNCGTELKEDAKFCKACGGQVKKAEPVAEKIMGNGGENKISSSERDFFKIIREQLSFLEKEYLEAEKKVKKAAQERVALQKLSGEMQQKIERLEQKNGEMESINADLNKKLSDAAAEIERLRSQTAGTRGVIRRCPNCNSPIDENTIFCGECGAKVR